MKCQLKIKKKNKLNINISADDNVNINTCKATLRDQPCISFNIGTNKQILTIRSNDNSWKHVTLFSNCTPLEIFCFHHWNVILNNMVFYLISRQCCWGLSKTIKILNCFSIEWNAWLISQCCLIFVYGYIITSSYIAI